MSNEPAAREPAATQRPRKQEQLPASTDITEVGPGVLRLQVPIFFTGLGHVNSYALIDKRGAAIVDAGMPGRSTWLALTSRLKSAGLSVRDVHTVIVTHSHPDHFGAAGRLAHEAGAELVTEQRFHTWLGPKSHTNGHGADACDDIIAGALDTGDEAATSATAPTSATSATSEDDDTGYFSSSMRTTPWGGSPIPHLQRTIWFMRLARLHLLPWMRPPVPTKRVAGGDHLRLAGRDWEVLHTPGHTGDHMCLFDPEARLLISGDHVLPTITPHVPGMSPLADPLGQYMRSLASMRHLDVTKVLPAHGNPFADLPGRIDEIVEHHEGRLAELRALVAAQGPMTVVDLSKELFRRPVWGMMAESETYAHLEYLRLQGELERFDLNGQAAYRLSG